MIDYHYCPRCLLPNTHPNTRFDADGVCLACKNYDKRKDIDWNARKEKLRMICDTYRSNYTTDVVCAVSGGKDSTFAVKTMVEDMNMQPILVCVADPFTKTQAGIQNFNNLKETFDCDTIVYEMGKKSLRRAVRSSFEELGEPLKYVEYLIYTVPTILAKKLGINLVIFGEDSYFQYGYGTEENPYANDTIRNIVKNLDLSFWQKTGLHASKFDFLSNDALINMPDVLYMSYFYEWDDKTHVDISKRYGFVDLSHEWKREGCIDDTSQIDSYGYITHLYLKYCKFYFQRVTDIVSREIRAGRIDIETGKKLILEKDHKLDQLALKSFINFCGYTQKEFYDIVDKFYNKDIFEKDKNGLWKPKIDRF